jgi:hypothetical protein
MANAKELRLWAETLRYWAGKLDENLASERAMVLAAEFDALAAGEEAADRQLV